MTKPVWSHVFGLECLDFNESSYSQLPDYKYLHARKIPHQLNFTFKTIPDWILLVSFTITLNHR